MKKRLFAILLSAILLLSLLPFVFASSADGEPAASSGEGVVQGEDDTVIILKDGALGTTAAGFQTATKQAPATGRTIFVLTYTCQLQYDSSKYTLVADNGWQDATLVFTSKVKMANLDKVYTLSAPDGTKTQVDPGEYEAGDVINHFDNEDTTKNVSLTSPAANVCILDCLCKTEFDYLDFRCGYANFFFYAEYFDITIGEHFKITPYNSNANGYPSFVNGLSKTGKEARESGGESSGSTFTGTQTIRILGGTWAYITPSCRDTAAAVSGTINLTLKNVTTMASVDLSGAPQTTVLMGRDRYTSAARVNVTIEDSTFAQLAFFAATTPAGTVKTNAGKLSVTMNGHNILTRGIENIPHNKNFTQVFTTAGASLMLTVNGTVTLGENKTIDGLDNATLTSTVRYDKTKLDPDLLINFDEEDDEFSPFVQGENDAVVFLGALEPDDLNTVFNSFADNRVKTSDNTLSEKYERIIVCLTQTYSFPNSASSNELFDTYMSGETTNYYSNRNGAFMGMDLAATPEREEIVFTSYVIVTDTDKVFSAEGTTVTKDIDKAATSYDYYTDGAVRAELTAAYYAAFCSNMTFDYVRFHVTQNVTPLFYMQYNDVFFGKHYQITSIGSAAYPILIQGQQYGITEASYTALQENPDAEVVYKFTERSPQEEEYSPLKSDKTQTVTVLGGTWRYISLRNRGTKNLGLTFLYGEINLTLENVTTKNNHTTLMGSDVYTASSRVNAKIKDCTFASFGFFEEAIQAHGNRQMYGTLSVTLEGENTFNSGITDVVPHTTTSLNRLINLSEANLTVTNNGTLVLAADTTISGACNYEGYSSSRGAYSKWINNGVIRYKNGDSVSADKIIGFNTYPTNDHGAIVYWNTSAKNDSWGLDADHPTRLLENALEYLRKSNEGYGTVMMVGNCWVNVSGNDYLNFPDLGGYELYIEAEENNDFLLGLIDPYLCLGGPATFKNINFAKTSARSIFAYDYDLTFDNCGYYKNDGSYSLSSPPEKGDPVKNIDDPTSTIFISTRGLSTDSISLANGKTIRQTIKITGNTDGFAVRRICAARKSGISSLYAPDTDASTGCDGQVNIVVGDNASVDYIDTIANEANTYKVNVTLPRALIENGKVQIKTANAAPSDGITTAVYVRGDSGDSVLQQNAPTFSKQGENGYSLRGLKDGKYAMRAGFKVPVSELENAVEYGVLVKRTNNTRPFAWFEGSGVNANKIGKSIVYLPALPEEEGIDNRWIVTESDVEYSSFTAPLTFAAATLNSTKAGNKYDFDPYVVYAYTFGGTTVKTVFRGSESGVSITNVSLQDMIDVCAAAIDKPVANALAAEIADVITDNG